MDNIIKINIKKLKNIFKNVFKKILNLKIFKLFQKLILTFCIQTLEY